MYLILIKNIMQNTQSIWSNQLISDLNDVNLLECAESIKDTYPDLNLKIVQNTSYCELFLEEKIVIPGWFKNTVEHQQVLTHVISAIPLLYEYSENFDTSSYDNKPDFQIGYGYSSNILFPRT